MENQKVISNSYSDKLIITPKKKLFFDDVFELDGIVDLIRITYSKIWHRPFKYIQIGGKTFAWMPSYALPSCIEDLPITFEFKKGDKFVIAGAMDVEKIELFYNDTKLKI